MTERISRHIERKRKTVSNLFAVAGWLCVFATGYSIGGLITGDTHKIGLSLQGAIIVVLLSLYAINAWHLANVKNLLKEEKQWKRT